MLSQIDKVPAIDFSQMIYSQSHWINSSYYDVSGNYHPDEFNVPSDMHWTYQAEQACYVVFQMNVATYRDYSTHPDWIGMLSIQATVGAWTVGIIDSWNDSTVNKEFTLNKGDVLDINYHHIGKRAPYGISQDIYHGYGLWVDEMRGKIPAAPDNEKYPISYYSDSIQVYLYR